MANIKPVVIISLTALGVGLGLYLILKNLKKTDTEDPEDTEDTEETEGSVIINGIRDNDGDELAYTLAFSSNNNFFGAEVYNPGSEDLKVSLRIANSSNQGKAHTKTLAAGQTNEYFVVYVYDDSQTTLPSGTYYLYYKIGSGSWVKVSGVTLISE